MDGGEKRILYFAGDRQPAATQLTFNEQLNNCGIVFQRFVELESLLEYFDDRQDNQQVLLIDAQAEDRSVTQLYTIFQNNWARMDPTLLVLIGAEMDPMLVDNHFQQGGNDVISLPLSERELTVKLWGYWAQLIPKIKLSNILKAMRHDLRSPIGVAHTGAQMLEAQMCGPMTEEQVEIAIRIKNSCDRYFQLLEDLNQ